MNATLIKCIFFYFIIISNCYALTVHPDKKIIAAHYTGTSWAPSFWSNLDIDEVANDLNDIKRNGFNSIIIVVPWSGFQTSISPRAYNEEYFKLLNQLIQEAKKQQVEVILRIGFAFEMGKTLSTPTHYERINHLNSKSIFLSAWIDYVQRLNKIALQHKNILFAFISWEDFSLIEVTNKDLEQRLSISAELGFQDFLKNRSLKTLSLAYQQEFSHYSDIPVPDYHSPAVYLFYQFWDEYLMRLYSQTKSYFSNLSMEVRLDCEPSNTTKAAICHEKTFDLNGQGDITIIYYHPAWGAANDGNNIGAERAIDNMQHLFNKVRSHTDNFLFIDQFNFIDNTPGFENNTKIKADEIPRFIDKASPHLKHKSLGYGLWLMQDKKANILANASFESGQQGWKIKNGQLIKDEFNTYQLLLKQSASLEQNFQIGASDYIKQNKTFIVEFDLKKNSKSKSIISIKLKDYKGYTIKQEQLKFISHSSEKIVLDTFPILEYGTLSIENSGGEVLVDNFMLYILVQENGIYDVNGNAKAFRDNIVAMNQSLAKVEKVPSFYNKSTIDSVYLQGVYKDAWASKYIVGKISNGSAIDKNEAAALNIGIYVPDAWKNYTNKLSLIYNQKMIGTAKLTPGYQTLVFKIKSEQLGNSLNSHFVLRADNDFLISEFDTSSSDTRRVAFLLDNIGFPDN